jgi:hypothetical protein
MRRFSPLEPIGGRVASSQRLTHRGDSMTRLEAKQWAKKRRVAFSRLEATYRDLRVVHRLEREREWEIRRTAWEMQRPPGCHPFWRHGFQVRYKRAFTEGDRCDIPGFDETAADMALRFPELNRDGDPAETLFEFLSQPHNRLPTTEETWNQVIARFENEPQVETVDELADVPF